MNYISIHEICSFRHRSKGENRSVQRSPSSDQDLHAQSLEVVNEIKVSIFTVYRAVPLVYNTPRYNIDLDMTQSCCHVVASKLFIHVIFQRSYRKMTIKWSFSYKSFVKIVLLYHDSFIMQSITMDPKIAL